MPNHPSEQRFQRMAIRGAISHIAAIAKARCKECEYGYPDGRCASSEECSIKSILEICRAHNHATSD